MTKAQESNTGFPVEVTSNGGDVCLGDGLPRQSTMGQWPIVVMPSGTVPGWAIVC